MGSGMAVSLLALSLAGTVSAADSVTPSAVPSSVPSKNLIVLIGDGMGSG